MWGLFKKRQQAVATEGEESRLGIIIRRYKRKVADGLQVATENMSSTNKKFLLGFTCLLGSLYCIALIMGSLGNSKLPEMGNMNKPLISKPVTPGASKQVDLLKLQQFRKYMDSLNETASGRITRDSILQHHPGLLDSLNKVEQLINHNK